MRINRSFFGILVNILLGVAWALALMGALYLFSAFMMGGLLSGLIMAFWGVLPGLFLVVILEYILIGFERLDELKKQTLLLEKIASNNSVTTTKEETVQEIAP